MRHMSTIYKIEVSMLISSYCGSIHETCNHEDASVIQLHPAEHILFFPQVGQSIRIQI